MRAASKKGFSLGHSRWETRHPLDRVHIKAAVWIGTVFLFSQLVDSFIIKQPIFFANFQSQRKSLSSISSTFSDFEDDILNPSMIQDLTVPELKQQLRLRGLKVSGKKQELVDRLANFSKNKASAGSSNEESFPLEPDVLSESESSETKPSRSKAQQLAEEAGKQFIDVAAYLDEEDLGKTVKSSIPSNPNEAEDENPPITEPETWGSEAKIIDDYEGRTPVVDGMSRTVIEFKGSNQTKVQAYVVASRDALKPFLAGGRNQTGSPEERLREIQTKRELAAKKPLKFEDDEGLDEGDENGWFANVLHREESDWGEYTLTGAQLSAQEVQGVLLLSDVYGAFTEDTKTLAENIAFECQPVVVMVPDIFRGDPWKEDPTTPGFNEAGKDYEEWRAMHSDLRVSVDTRAAAAVLREQYGVSSIVVWGTCYGGGRALEIAAGYLPSVHDVDGETIGPPLVEPAVAIAWYPTRYNAQDLYGADKTKQSSADGKERSMAIMGVFAGNDHLEGATPDDATILKKVLEEDERVKDHMVKVFPNQDHGFAHIGLGTAHADSELDRFVDEEFGGAGRVSMDGGDAEVACLLSTAFMETYSRVFLPTTGPPICNDDLATEWNSDLNMKDLQANSRDIRQEIEDSLDNFEEVPLGGKMVDPTDDAQTRELINILKAMELPDVDPELKIQDDDDINMIYAKLKASDESFTIF